MDTPLYDLLVVGGGINGCGIARDAAGRGLCVLLVEQGDLGAATSSASSKLIHGGLRYLEQFAFRLVRESLVERERLLASAPHLIRPLRFVVPHDAGVRPWWTVRLGLVVYDHLARRRQLARSAAVSFAGHPFGAPLQPRFARGFAYTDCWVDDARLVVAAARDAHERGATIATRTRLVAAQRQSGVWRATLEDADTGAHRAARARILVNAAGPWVAAVLEQALAVRTAKRLRLVKGSHIVVPKLYEGDHAYLLQNADRRVVFAIPYEGVFTLIGTTDVAYDGDPGRVVTESGEIDYLCACAGRFFRCRVEPDDVLWTFAGVRPLFDDGAVDAQVVTRDYAFDLDAADGAAPVLSVFGGKLTTFRRLAEHAMDALRPRLPGLAAAWTATAKLPGGDLEGNDPHALAVELRRRHPFLDAGQALRLARAYGTCCSRFLGGAARWEDLGEHFGGGLTEAELDHLTTREWARSAEDVLWRRTKLGLHLDAAARSRVADRLAGAQATATRREPALDVGGRA